LAEICMLTPRQVRVWASAARALGRESVTTAGLPRQGRRAWPGGQGPRAGKDRSR
jgi:hypothetical protein